MAVAFSVTTTAATGTVLPVLGAPDVTGNTFVNTGREWIEIANGSATPLTATIVTSGTYSVGTVSYAIADNVVVVANATSKICGPFDVGLYGSVVTITWSSITTITARVCSLGAA
jgi:hypothetical protein